MKVALVGYGKMGKAIEQILLSKGFVISHKITSKNNEEIDLIQPNNTDIVIEFTNPNTAFDNISKILKSGVSVVSGTTGWTDRKFEIEKLAIENNLGFLWASNFSIGVNLFFQLNEYTAKLMQRYDQYNCSIQEIHHTQKLDKPSGTAITIAEQIINNNPRYIGWNLDGMIEKEIKIEAIRQDPAPGTHSVCYKSEIDDIEIIHTAHSRQGFAMGAVLAAQFLNGKIGIFSMKDVLNF